jgi:class 3 adenylate cyclase
MNIGIHWGDRLFMGQVVTGGRIEVTALGDEVNECARIEQAASDGEILASKQAIERLSPDDAAALGLDPAQLTYETLAERGKASEKAIRDAGGVAVTDARPRG